MADAVGIPQRVILFEFVEPVRVVHAVALAAALLDEGKAGDVARTVRDVNHVRELDAPVLGRDLRIHVEHRVLVGALVDLEKRPGLRGVVDHHADLRDLGIGPQLELLLLKKTGLERVFDELAAPNAVDVRGDGAAANHLGDAGADNVVLELDLVLQVFGVLGHKAPAFYKEFRQPLVELDLGAEFMEHFVVQLRHQPGAHIGEDVVQVADLAGNAVAALGVVLDQLVGLGPERRLIDSVTAEERPLHVARNKSLVEVPDAGDDGLSEERRSHG